MTIFKGFDGLDDVDEFIYPTGRWLSVRRRPQTDDIMKMLHLIFIMVFVSASSVRKSMRAVKVFVDIEGPIPFRMAI